MQLHIEQIEASVLPSSRAQKSQRNEVTKERRVS
jgi:hypothetical protein